MFLTEPTKPTAYASERSSEERTMPALNRNGKKKASTSVGYYQIESLTEGAQESGIALHCQWTRIRL